MAVQYARKRVTSDAQNFRCLGDVQPEWNQAVLPYAVAGMRRTVHRHIATSSYVVVNQVDIVNITIVKAEYDPPAAGNRDTLKSFQNTFQRVKTVTGKFYYPKNDSSSATVSRGFSSGTKWPQSSGFPETSSAFSLHTPSTS